jgi:NADPH-dependent 2,4-dienoyl-CoA reductase/sulfur reductase-like enzyme
VRIIVVGGSVAGIAACQALRAEGWEDEIVLISDERISYDRPPLSKRVLLGTTGPGELELADFQEFERLRIDRRSPTRAEELDLDRSVLHVDGGELAFDGLIIATGSHARLPPSRPMGFIFYGRSMTLCASEPHFSGLTTSSSLAPDSSDLKWLLVHGASGSV